ncbi:hypothetical protein C2E23DRAFT_499951 [Lenzites betulinus]|nr:hypothetical protein C2E23DRAFT_499951 [Lenzites betulinus]
MPVGARRTSPTATRPDVCSQRRLLRTLACMYPPRSPSFGAFRAEMEMRHVRASSGTQTPKRPSRLDGAAYCRATQGAHSHRRTATTPQGPPRSEQIQYVRCGGTSWLAPGHRNRRRASAARWIAAQRKTYTRIDMPQAPSDARRDPSENECVTWQLGPPGAHPPKRASRLDGVSRRRKTRDAHAHGRALPSRQLSTRSEPFQVGAGTDDLARSCRVYDGRRGRRRAHFRCEVGGLCTVVWPRPTPDARRRAMRGLRSRTRGRRSRYEADRRVFASNVNEADVDGHTRECISE